MPPRGYGGLEAICSDLVDALVARGHDVNDRRRCAQHDPGARFVSTTETPQRQRLNESLPDVLHAARAHRVLAAGGFDVIHDHTNPGPLTAGLHQAPTVVTVHGAVDGELGDYLAVLGDTVQLVAISDDQRASRPDLGWLSTVHNGVDPATVYSGAFGSPAEPTADPGPEG